MSGFLKLVLVGLAILFVYGYITRPAVPNSQTTATPASDYSGFRAQTPGAQETTAAQDGAALAARDEARRRADPSQCLVLQSPKTVAEEYSISITGAIKNTCGHTFRYIQITWKLLDGSGAVVGTALANQSNLDDGETWKFKAHALTEFAKYRLDKITAF